VVEAANILACLSALFLLAAIASWVRLVHRQGLWGLDGQLAVGPQAEFASQLLILALISSAVAATLALVGHFAP
jgi:hypothetical protein